MGEILIVKTITKNLYILYTLAHLKQKANVRGTWLGYLWWFIEPLMLIALYSYVVGVIFGHSEEHRILMIAVGVTTWKWFSSSLRSATTSFKRYKGIVCQVKMPLYLLPISIVFGETYLFIFGYILLQLIFLFLGYTPDLLAVLLAFTTALIAISAMSLILSVLNVFIKDVSFLISFGLRVMFYITPIIYTPQRVPEKYQFLITYNPFAYLINYFNSALIFTNNVDYLEMIYGLLSSAVVLIFLIALCKKMTNHIIRNV